MASKELFIDIATYQLVDSLKKKSINLDHLPENGIANVVYHMVMKAMVAGKLQSIVGYDSAMLEEYLGRLGSLYIGKSFYHGKIRDAEAFGDDAKAQIMYSVAVELRKAVGPQIATLAVAKPAAVAQPRGF